MKISNRIPILISLILSTVSFMAAAQSNDGFRKIFNGKTMKNWEGDTTHWSIVDGSFVGVVSKEKPLKTNTFMIYRGNIPDNFEFKAEYRISPEGNSGVQYRSEKVENLPFALKGYQADIDGANRYTGQNYEERGRGFLAMRGEQSVLKEGQKPTITGSLGNTDDLKSKIKKDDWNEIHIIAKGNHLQHYINGVLMSETTDEDQVKRKLNGLIGLQVHVMAKMKVEYRNIYLKKIK
jgi:hypothetical protein